jgi:2-polyprenyl-3-methyl-5-hydroxy-6-metoxy-1,4-benzoquinol methylase
VLSEKDQAERDALLARMYTSTIGTLELFHVYLGEHLGLYQALATGGPLTSAGLASAAGINERYAREWLEEQAVAGILAVEPGVQIAEGRRFSLPLGHAEVLNDVDSINFFAPIGRALVGIGTAMPKVVNAFRTGGGVPYEAYGAEIRCSIAAMNRPGFLTQLGSEWFSVIADVDQRLRSQPPARVADVGCGSGWSSIAIAIAYPLVNVDGLDLDVASIDDARGNADAMRVADRVTFHVRDAADPSLVGSYDLVTAFETIHDMSNPVGALRAMRALAKDGGAVVIADEKVAEEFTAPGDERERFAYGLSALHCLPAGMASTPSAGTGTVMRPATMRRYAREAGFADVEILPIENESLTFYRLA